MKRAPMLVITMALTLGAFGSGCVYYGEGYAGTVVYDEPSGPPPWAPAYGYRDPHHFRYWPDYNVYFDIAGGEYTWYADGVWRCGPVLPAEMIFVLNLGWVEFDIEGSNPRPYHRKICEYYRHREPGRVERRDYPNRHPQTRTPDHGHSPGPGEPGRRGANPGSGGGGRLGGGRP